MMLCSIPKGNDLHESLGSGERPNISGADVNTGNMDEGGIAQPPIRMHDNDTEEIR